MTRDSEKITPSVSDSQQPASNGQADQKKDPVPGGSLSVPMFGNFTAAKKRKLPKWAAPLLGAMMLFHVVLFVTMWVKTIWDIEQLDRPKNSFDLAIAPPPPPPAAPPKGGVKPKDAPITPRKIKVKDIVQPVKIEKQEVVAPVTSGDENGVEGGAEDGVPSGDLNGVVAAPPPPPPPPPPAPPTNVNPVAADQKRIAGERLIFPDDVTKTEIGRSGKDKLIGNYKLCITVDGNIKSVQLMKSTGFPAYDAKIQNTIRGEWRYSPFTVNGKAVEVCTVVTFIYSQR